MSPHNGFVVTPWEVRGRVDYEKLVQQFGTSLIDEALLERIRHAFGELHHMLRRGLFYSHRDFNKILDLFAAGKKFYLYTGRGPSGHTHLGHIVPWVFTRHLQERFGVPLYFQLTDDEKFLFNDDLELDNTKGYALENALDFIALGFEPRDTRVIIDTEYIHNLYPIALRVAKRVTFSTAKAVFGFTPSNNIGEIFYTSIQAAPCFLEAVKGEKVPSLIPCAIDQDPHFRVARDVAPLLGYPKTALIHTKLLPALTGPEEKMAASVPQSAIFTTDDARSARRKIMNAFTGGAVSVKEQRESGGNPEVCSVYSYYVYLFESEDTKLKEIERRCRSGEMLCGECKSDLAERVLSFLAHHQAMRERARDHIEDYLLKD
ncbi:MAG: tryptophan--tRNA ligase [Candidatus Thermoplasmatota archaeon]